MTGVTLALVLFESSSESQHCKNSLAKEFENRKKQKECESVNILESVERCRKRKEEKIVLIVSVHSSLFNFAVYFHSFVSIPMSDVLYSPSLFPILLEGSFNICLSLCFLQPRPSPLLSGRQTDQEVKMPSTRRTSRGKRELRDGRGPRKGLGWDRGAREARVRANSRRHS